MAKTYKNPFKAWLYNICAVGSIYPFYLLIPVALFFDAKICTTQQLKLRPASRNMVRQELPPCNVEAHANIPATFLTVLCT